MPNGFTSCGERYEYNLFKLTDSTNQYYERIVQCGRDESKTDQYSPEHYIFETEKECINCLKDFIIGRLRKEGHRGHKDHLMEKTTKKIWYIG